MPTLNAAKTTTDLLLDLQFMNACEQQRCLDLFDPNQPFAQAVAACESLHIHLKVDDTAQLPMDAFQHAGCQLDYAKEGFTKLLTGNGINLIFSSIAIAQDDLSETEQQQRKRPFVDHFGIDLRNESAEVKAEFDMVPAIAASKNWQSIPQGESGNGVHCCHVEVSEKHWVYPSAEAPAPQIPLEFAFGKLQLNEVAGGCDLRPMDPTKRAALGESAPSCAG